MTKFSKSKVYKDLSRHLWPTCQKLSR